MNKRYNAGFTLMELMIVIGIIALLGAILIPSMLQSRAEAHLQACKDNLEAIHAAEVEYYADKGTYLSIDDLVDRQILREVPVCPSSGSAYVFSGAEATGGLTGYSAYTINCHGNHTRCDVTSGFPEYSSGKGLRLHN